MNDKRMLCAINVILVTNFFTFYINGPFIILILVCGLSIIKKAVKIVLKIIGIVTNKLRSYCNFNI